jgi:plastocyanin
VSVKLTKAPPVQEVKLNKDVKGCGHETMKSGRAEFDPATLGLGNAVVWLTDIARGKDFEGDLAQADRKVILDQKACAYVPHVMLVRAGAKVSVKNSDDIQHNAKAFLNTKATLKFNVMSSSQSALDPSDDTTLEKAGNYILNCDIHHWMTGYIRAIPHPYYAITSADGTCGFTNVPPGEYRIGCWHEGMLVEMVTTGAEITGYKFSEDFELPVQTVLVPAEGTVDVNFTTEPR